MTIKYLNTDLDLASALDLTALAAGLGGLGLFALHVERRGDGLWYATFETEESYAEPEHSIVAMLAAVESLGGPLAASWLACAVREFNVGYESGDGPWGFNQVISCETLRRVSAEGAALRITLYPPAPPAPAGP